ncbi:class D beta-lactamase [Arundinibacter roseus]|uniref:beta-lactamase n=1 Tax=Arundinibacter roseus TaxID=2070510 RepID=A0A4R4KKJ2_9BACT|nr:class D beta-lactamase [Arundinibacter roseus]TDB67482.1 class D beta-lactamase [Arundinibacter roseus]
MTWHYIFAGLFVSFGTFSCSNQNKSGNSSHADKRDTLSIRNDFQSYFDSCRVEGAIVVYDGKRKQWIMSDTLETRLETLPASTFKIINLLIALETRTIEDENTVVKWVGSTDTVKYGYRPEIYHDMTVKEAFEVSAGWVFIELAKKIGRENYKKYLSLTDYGNLDLSQTDADFWNFGAFKISPLNQVEFIKKLYEEKLPFSKRTMQLVKKVMITQQLDGYTFHTKTGWTRDNNTNTGWWVGYIEKEKEVYIFATRLLQDRTFNSPMFGNCRKDITKAVFRDLGILN